MKALPVRKKIRLQGYDYSSNGAYFVTICALDKLPLFGRIVVGADDSVRPSIEISEIGQIVFDCWNKIDAIYTNIRTDVFCVMPNHIHGIILIDETGGQCSLKTGGQCSLKTGGQGRPPLQKVVQGFKSVTTRLCFEMGYQKIWQRSYHDHIIRNEAEYQKILRYIDENPARWQDDCYYAL